MADNTYEIRESNGWTLICCRLCGAESRDQENISRLYCGQCSWFHEPFDENRSEMLRHIQAALSEVGTALDLAEALNDEDQHRQDRLRSAQRDLRRALSRC